MAEKFEIDVEVLISCVQNKPMIWNKTLEEYKDKNSTKKAWKEICVQLYPDFNSLDDKKKTELDKNIRAKWTNVRDAFIRARKNIKLKKRFGNGAVPIKQYIYNDQLQFLLPAITQNDTQDSLARTNDDTMGIQEDKLDEKLDALRSAQNEEECISRSISQSGGQKLEKLGVVKKRVLEVLAESEKKPNRHLSFFQGIIPSLDDFSDDEILQFQSRVLKLIMDIKRQRRGYQNTSSTASHQYPAPFS